MATLDLSIVNQAIGRAGGEPIDALNDDTPLSAFAMETWPTKKAWLLAAYRWVFAETFAPLEQLATAPPGCPLPFAFKRPADLSGAIHAIRDGSDVRTACQVQAIQTEDYLAADRAPLWAEYTGGADATRWPPWFTELAIVAFAADVAYRMLRRTLGDEFQAKAFGTPEQNGQGGLMLAAMQADSRNAPQRSLEYASGGALVAARYGVGVGVSRGGLGWPNNGFPFVIEVTQG